MNHEEVIDALVESCESLFLQSVAMESILDKLAPEDWRHMMDTIIDSDEAIQVRASFRYTLRAAVRIGDPGQILASLQPKSRRPR